MKKIIALLLSGLLCFSLCACGGTSTVVKSKLGDTVSTNMFDCTLIRAEFSDEVCNFFGNTFLLPCEKNHPHSGNPYTADEGYQLLCFSFELKYLGTTEYKLGLGKSNMMDFMVKFDDTYEFDSFVISASTNPNEKWESPYKLESDNYMPSLSNTAFNFAPLEETIHEFRVYIPVPNQVAESTDKSVDIIITLCDEDIVFSVG